MLSIINSMSLHGLDGFLVSVEVDVSSGMPSWDVVGLPDISIKESKERVKTAIKNSGIELKSRKVIINLSPADIKKEGSIFDLAIAIGILVNMGIIKCENIKEYVFIGELSLNGKINKINGILPMCIEAKKLGINKIIIPKENEKEASIVKDIRIIGVETLNDLIKYLKTINYDVNISLYNIYLNDVYQVVLKLQKDENNSMLLEEFMECKIALNEFIASEVQNAFDKMFNKNFTTLEEMTTFIAEKYNKKI